MKEDEEDIVTAVLHEQQSASSLRLACCSVVFLLQSISLGFEFSFTVSAQKFYDPNAPSYSPEADSLVMTDEQISWFVSMTSMTMMPGSLLAGLASHRFGCKLTLMASSCLILAGHAVILAANLSWQVILARAVQGLSMGVILPTLLTVLSELSTVRLRGFLLTTVVMCSNGGTLLGLCVAKLVPEGLRPLVLVFAAAPLSFLALSPMLPESPAFIARTTRDRRQVEKSLRRIRGPNCNVSAEATELLLCTKKEHENGVDLAYFYSRQAAQPLFLMVVQMSLVSLSGLDALFYYSLLLFRDQDLAVELYTLSILCQAGISLGCLFVAPFMHSVSRKGLASRTALPMALMLLVMALSLNTTDLGSSDQTWKTWTQFAPPICIFIFSLLFGGGFGNVCWTLAGEIFPPRAKSVGCGFCIMVRFTVLFFLLKFYPWLVSTLTSTGAILGHACVMIVATIFIIVCLPETRGLTVYQITNLFEDNKDKEAVAEEESATELTDITSGSSLARMVDE